MRNRAILCKDALVVGCPDLEVQVVLGVDVEPAEDLVAEGVGVSARYEQLRVDCFKLKVHCEIRAIRLQL